MCIRDRSLDDVVLKLTSDCDESAADLLRAVQTLQRGDSTEIRTLCNPWGVLIEEAKKHFRAKATGAGSQTSQIPAGAEATMQGPGNASILRGSDSAVEPPCL